MNLSPYVRDAAEQARTEREYLISTGRPEGRILQLRDKIQEAEALIREVTDRVESNSVEGRGVHLTADDLAQCISSEIIGQFLPAMEEALKEWVDREDER